MDKETVNKLIINSLIKKGYKLEEVDQDFLNDMAEIMYKQLALCNVSCQREQLSQYNDFVNMQYHGVSLDDSDIDDFNDWLNCN